MGYLSEILADRYIRRIKVVKEISSDGFSIERNNRIKKHFWNDIVSVSFDEDKTHLKLKKRNWKSLKLGNDIHNWYALIQSIPLGYKEFDYDYVRVFFHTLITCDICGTISVKNDKCLVCGSSPFDDSLLNDYESKEDYIKSEQLEIFALTYEIEPFDGFYETALGFNLDTNWKPLITEDELYEFCKEEYLDI